MTGTIFDIQRFSVSDGPGIRTTVFMKGCPLRCRWCHNPEGLRGAPQTGFTREKCIGCGRCAGITGNADMPAAAAGRALDAAATRAAECCPTGAFRVFGETLTVDEVMRRVLRDRDFYAEDGGVTFSGGEPTFQPEFLLALLKAAKAEGLNTAVDTCGMAQPEVYASIAPYTDLALFDVKAADSGVHRDATGFGNELILRNLTLLDRLLNHIWIRVPLIRGVNADSSEISRISDILDGCRHIEKVTLIPYHTLGVRKYEALGMLPDPADLSPEEDVPGRLEELLRARGYNVSK